jgi:recombinational DNA repair ATPase RecF
MYVDHLSLENYRGFSSAEFSFQPGVNVLFGPNGSGKSSVWEALTMMLSWHVVRLKSASGVGKTFQEKQITNEAPYARVKTNIKEEIPF